MWKHESTIKQFSAFDTKLTHWIDDKAHIRPFTMMLSKAQRKTLVDVVHYNVIVLNLGIKNQNVFERL